MKMPFALILPLLTVVCCATDQPEQKPALPPGGTVQTDPRYPVVDSPYMPAVQETGDFIPDFSRVGYRWGDAEIPTVPVAATLSPPADGGDATRKIQEAIDAIPTPGAILLTKGTYNVHGSLRIGRNGVVLRGEGDSETDGTVLVAAGATKRDLITIGGTGSRSVKNNTAEYDVLDDYVPAGRFWVRSAKASEFSPGDNVVIYRPSATEWITDLKMDQIPPRADGLPVTQWEPGRFDLYAERVVTLVKGDTVHFENPVVMSLDKRYGGGRLLKYSYADRISECGVEDIRFRSEFTHPEDEAHGWNAVAVKVAEHCWIRNVTAQHFGMGLATLDNYSKNITVVGCECIEPVSTVAGSRRYSYHINQGQLCLVKDCTSDNARHDFATGPLNCGPNVFTNCRATNTLADIGPHQRWNSATLYDNITTDGEICVQDRSNYGSGQGWAAATNVLWNCTARLVIVQSPWVSAYNYSIGTVGSKSPGKFTNPLRPDGVWLSPGVKVSPASLYDAQLELRRAYSPGGVMDIK